MDHFSEGEADSSLRYSTDELLRLRTSIPFVLLDLEKLNIDAETCKLP